MTRELESVQFAEKGGDGDDGEAHDVEEVAFDAGDPAGGVALDAVGSGFVERVPGGKIEGEVVVGDGGEEHAGGFDVRALACRRDDGDAGVNLMDAVGKLAEHSFSVGEIFGFVEDL